LSEGTENPEAERTYPPFSGIESVGGAARVIGLKVAVEITRHRFMKDLSIGKITIGTEEMPPREGESRARMVSTIEIALTRE
jgi:DNA-binding protein Alba